MPLPKTSKMYSKDRRDRALRPKYLICFFGKPFLVRTNNLILFCKTVYQVPTVFLPLVALYHGNPKRTQNLLSEAFDGHEHSIQRVPHTTSQVATDVASEPLTIQNHHLILTIPLEKYLGNSVHSFLFGALQAETTVL